MGDCLQRFFFPGRLSKIGELFINNSISVEQAISYFAVTGVSKHVLLLALITFHLRSAKRFFHGLRDRFLSYIQLSSAHEKTSGYIAVDIPHLIHRKIAVF